ncbi:hypothetical protein BCR39DRAFT_557421 [Naematelia encephala]|uniref:AAA protein C-terminal winged helix domain-containing protein n=1 Tax=Naematelia encephala TaxID=71784 RepID=A0A1Y2BDL5_9TREE|nr:hypothetical protein BCR39DRAFT_557421 [Naematelia encephala]
MPQSPVGPSSNLDPSQPSARHQRESFWKQWSSSASFQAALTTVVGLGMVFAAGVGYLEWYKAHVLHRIERAFAPGYDPALEVSTLQGPDASHIRRAEQPLIDSIVRGEHAGGYYLMIGPKGTGKGTMIVDAMRKISADGAAFCEAHPDLEVFRLRLGKALDFDFYEDWQGSLFSRADPRQGGPGLDVERVMTKLEKVALRYAKKKWKATCDVHLFPNSPEGHAILHQLQQRAEAWAEGGLMTMIFSTDDFWPLDVMRKNASRMRIVSVYDLPRKESLNALRRLRQQALKTQYPAQEVEVENDEILGKIYDIVGGRTSYLGRVARAPNMLEEAEGMIEWERNWLSSKIGLIPEHDDDVMDEQKWSSCSWLLLRHLAKMAPTLPGVGPTTVPDNEEESTHTGPEPDDEDTSLPKVTFEEARRIMTRTDFVQDLDHLHVHHHVRIDSTLLLRAAQQVINEEGFDEALDVTRDRIDQIEGLHRQNELTVKEPFKITLGEEAGRTVLEVIGLGDSFVPTETSDQEETEGRLV